MATCTAHVTLKDLLHEADVTPAEYRDALHISLKRTKIILRRTPAAQCTNPYNPVILFTTPLLLLHLFSLLHHSSYFTSSLYYTTPLAPCTLSFLRPPSDGRATQLFSLQCRNELL